MNPHPGVNMIHSNVKRIARCPRAKELDAETVAKLEFLGDALCEQESIFKRLYEDSVLGRITTEQFQSLAGSYTAEQEALKADIPQREADIKTLREKASGTDGFIARTKRYTDITELTPELLRLFILKIVVHEKSVKWSKHAQQTVEIHYTDIGYVGETTSAGDK